MSNSRTAKMAPTLLHKLVRYDPATGKLYWRFRTPDMFRDGVRRPAARCRVWNDTHATKEAFRPLPGNRPRQERIFGRSYLATHVVWALTCGEWPTGIIRHRDGDLTNNRVENLFETYLGSWRSSEPEPSKPAPAKVCDRASQKPPPPSPVATTPTDPLNPYHGVYWVPKKGLWAAITRANPAGPVDDLPRRGISSGPPHLIGGFGTPEEAREAVLRAERAVGYDESLSIPPLRSVRGYDGVCARDPEHPAICDDYPAHEYFTRVTLSAPGDTSRTVHRGPFGTPDEAHDEYWRIVGKYHALNAG